MPIQQTAQSTNPESRYLLCGNIWKWVMDHFKITKEKRWSLSSSSSSHKDSMSGWSDCNQTNCLNVKPCIHDNKLVCCFTCSKVHIVQWTVVQRQAMRHRKCVTHGRKCSIGEWADANSLCWVVKQEPAACLLCVCRDQLFEWVSYHLKLQHAHKKSTPAKVVKYPVVAFHAVNYLNDVNHMTLLHQWLPWVW